MLKNWLMPSKVAAVLSLPLLPKVGQVPTVQPPLFARPDVSAMLVAPADSFKCISSTVFVMPDQPPALLFGISHIVGLISSAPDTGFQIVPLCVPPPKPSVVLSSSIWSGETVRVKTPAGKMSVITTPVKAEGP